MRKFVIVSSIVLLTAAAAPASAAPTSVQSVGNQVASSDTPIQPIAGARPQAIAAPKICRQLPSSYSRLPQRVCLTKDEWAKVDDDNR